MCDDEAQSNTLITYCTIQVKIMCKQYGVAALHAADLHVLLRVPRPLEHVQHALRDGEPAPNVDR